MTDQPISRRQALAGGTVAAASMALLAACGNSPSFNRAAAPNTTTGDPTASGTTKPAGQPSPDGSTPATSGTTLLATSQVPVGGSAAATDKGQPVIVSQRKAGKFTCFSAVCTHMGCTVNPAGPRLVCPCHGSVYDAFTGAVMAGPAPSPLPAVSVAVSGSNVVAT